MSNETQKASTQNKTKKASIPFVSQKYQWRDKMVGMGRMGRDGFSLLRRVLVLVCGAMAIIQTNE